MKKLFFAFFVFLVALTACEGGGDTPKDITVTGGSTNQTLYADETSANNGEGIKFTTSGAWRAEVEEATRSVSWLELSQTSGDKAGEYTLKITLQENTTGAARKATVKIICGDTTITISVEQKGIKKDEDPNPNPNPDPNPNPEPDPDSEMLISKIVVKEKTSDGSYKYLSEADFTYDGQKRPVKVVSSIKGSADGRMEITYDYATNKMTDVFHEGSYIGGVWEYGSTDVITFSLNSDGYVVSADGKGESKKNGVLKYFSEYTNRFTYTEDGYVATQYFHQVNSNADGSDKFEDGPRDVEYVWSGGNRIYMQERDSKVKYSEWGYNNLPNNSNLDLNEMINRSDDLNYTMVFSKLGKRSKNRMSKISYAVNPNPVVSGFSSAVKSTEDTTITYETAHDGAVTKLYVIDAYYTMLYEITYINK